MAKTFLKSLAALALLTGNTMGQFLKYHDQVEILTDNLNGATETIGLDLVANEVGLGDLDLAKCLQSLEKELRPLNIQINEVYLVSPLSNDNVYMAFEGKIKVKNEWKYVRLPGVQITTSGKTCSMADDNDVDKIPANLDFALDVDSGDGRRLGRYPRRPRGQGSTNLWGEPNTCLDSSEFEPAVLTGPTHPYETSRKCWENGPSPATPCNDPSATGWFTIVQDLDELNQIVAQACTLKFDTVALCCDEEFSLQQSGGHTLAGKAGYYDYSGVQECQDQPRSMYGVWESTSDGESQYYELMKLHGAWGDDMRRVLFQRLLKYDAATGQDEKWEKVALSCNTNKQFVEKDCDDTKFKCIDPFTM